MQASCLFFFAVVCAAYGQMDKMEDFFLESLDALDDEDAPALAAHYSPLIKKYAEEIKEERGKAFKFQVHIKKVLPFKCVGQMDSIEVSMLYIMIRETKPTQVVDIGALCGSSTRWILAALAKNGVGHLKTFDLMDACPKAIKAFDGVAGLDRWEFRQQDVKLILDKSPKAFAHVDIMVIDALHQNQFAQWYTKALLKPAAKKQYVFIHDIFNPYMVPQYKPCKEAGKVKMKNYEVERACIARIAANWTQHNNGQDLLYGAAQPVGEGVEVMSWLARTQRCAGFLTLSPYAAREFSSQIFEVYKSIGFPFGHSTNPGIMFALKPVQR